MWCRQGAPFPSRAHLSWQNTVRVRRLLTLCLVLSFSLQISGQCCAETHTPENAGFSPTIPFNSALLSGLWVFSPVWHRAEEGISIPYVLFPEVACDITPYHEKVREADAVIRPLSGSLKCVPS